MADPGQPSFPGSAYRIIAEVRRHGGLVTWTAKDLQGGTISLQMLEDISASANTPAAPEVVERLRRFQHPRAARVLDVGTTSNRQPFLASEYRPGVSLWQRCSFQSGVLTVTRPLDVAAAIRVLRQIAEVLDAAHRAELVHGSVEPGAILLAGAAQNAEPLESTLANFGVVFLLNPDPKHQLAVAAMDTRSPEVLAGSQAKPSSDQFSLAAVSYWMLTGQAPFSGASRAFPAAASSDLELGRMLPPPAERVLRKGLAEAPPDRYASCREFVDRLEEAVTSRAQPDATARLKAGHVVAAEYPMPEAVTARRFLLDLAAGLRPRFFAAAVVTAVVCAFVYGARLIEWFRDYIASR